MKAFPAKFVPELNLSNISSKTSIITMSLCSGKFCLNVESNLESCYS